ncbi:MAG: DNA-3-methyladenine glycosylase 2 family protein [Sinobacteraceae bacterium]|nr:DNA-3-methyladenine glycosylase 2 family protein [Nevskiaceae bacterium]
MTQHITDHLAQADPVMAALIAAVGAFGLQPEAELDAFQTLARAITHQQLNGTAANTILARLIAGCGQGRFPSPQHVLDATPASLRAAGFSLAKVAALRDLAEKTLARVVPDHEELLALSDEAIIERLTQVRGIGRWTVEMLLLFRLGRPDVLPVDDFGVRAGFRAAYGLRALPHPKALAAFGERWRPYRSAAAWYLWRAVELHRTGRLPPPAVRIRLPRVKKKKRSSERTAPARRPTKRVTPRVVRAQRSRRRRPRK